jgi:hypothetical protein
MVMTAMVVTQCCENIKAVILTFSETKDNWVLEDEFFEDIF